MNTTILKFCTFASVAAALSFTALRPSTARADTPAQTQKAIQAVCSRAAASYQRHDLTGIMAMCSPDCTIRNVMGRKITCRQSRGALAKAFTKNNYNPIVQCIVSQAAVQGNTANAVLRWHCIDHHQRSVSSPAYVYIRNYKRMLFGRKLPPAGLKPART